MCSMEYGGPSPRGRGRRRDAGRQRRSRGSIPAWAGATRCCRRSGCPTRVHPRVGGGDHVHDQGTASIGGPSPRGRGRRPSVGGSGSTRGSIPAWAGATRAPHGAHTRARVHPRVGGGDYGRRRRSGDAAGPSPRGRGRRTTPRPAAARRGSIPAWAGATRCASCAQTRSGVHPRVGGGDAIALPTRTASTGPSPRGRGRLSGQRRCRAPAGSIPAWAGATSALRCRASRCGVHPRVGGGDLPELQVALGEAGPSPRGRGRHDERGRERRVGGSIPAWAGATILRTAVRSAPRVHPRVGGGDVTNSTPEPDGSGPSPRGRGRHTRSSRR